MLIGLLGVLPELELLPYELTNKTLASTQSTYKFIIEKEEYNDLKQNIDYFYRKLHDNKNREAKVNQ